MRKSRSIVLLAGLVIILATLAYFLNFKNQDISSETDKWGAFSDYLNPFVSTANLIVFIWLSIEVFNYNQKKDDQNENFQKAIEKPVLILKSKINPTTRIETWTIKNIGNGAALNLKVSESPNRIPNWVNPVTKCYSLGKDDKLKLSWFTNANIICVVYQDIFQHSYVSLAADDETFIQPLNSEFRSIKIKERIFSMDDFEDFLKLPTQRLHEALFTSSQSTTTQTTNPNG